MPFDVAIDALFGVGLRRDLGPDAALAARMTRWGTGWVVAVDVPSGIHADTGDVMGTAVKADLTVTFSRGKPGLYVGQGAVHSGRVVIADIGIPGEVYPERPQTVLVGREDLYLAPRRMDGHKGDFGKLFILAGSRGYTGAAALCARAAVRSGVGLTTLAVPEEVYPILAAKCCDEVMVWPWAESGDEIVEKAKGCTAAVIGPGLGQGGRAEELVLTLLRELTCPVILDADGLNIISRHIDVLDEREGAAILTPHETAVKGDSRSASIAAASILAKVSRDRYMLALAEEYPQYHFEQHKGYGTALHRAMLDAWGPCPAHRRSFLKKWEAGRGG